MPRLTSLEAQIAGLRSDADRRVAEADAWKQRMDKLVDEETKGANHTDTTPSAAIKSLTAAVASAYGNKRQRGVIAALEITTAGTGSEAAARWTEAGGGDVDDEAMDVDEDDEDGKKEGRAGGNYRVCGRRICIENSICARVYTPQLPKTLRGGTPAAGG